MRSASLRKLGLVAVATLTAPFVAVGVLALAVDHWAGARAERIIASQAAQGDHVSLASGLTAGVHSAFAEAGEHGPAIAALHSMRPYWTNDLLPSFLRPSEGALDLLVARGDCDTYARALVFVLERRGFEARQLNIVSRQGGGHSITLAWSEEAGALLLDPQYALVAMHDGAPIGPDALRMLAAAGVDAVDLWRSVVPGGEPAAILSTFDYGDAAYAPQGRPLKMVDRISLRPGQKLVIGEADGRQIDHSALLDAGLHAHWHYVGSRYDRSWVRIMKFTQDTKVVIATTERPDRRFLTTDETPRVEDDRIVYTLQAGESLVFADGEAGRDWLRLRSYQDIDSISFVALDGKSAQNR